MPVDADALPAGTVFGLPGITHGAAKTLTMMSDMGATVLSERLQHIATEQSLNLQVRQGYLPILYERKCGEIDRLVTTLSIRVVTKRFWDEQKTRLGDTIYQ